jgi:hypothetical protein
MIKYWPVFVFLQDWLMVYFFKVYRANYKVANFAILISLISGVIVLIFNIMVGLLWFVAIKYIVIPVTIALTYFEEFKGVNTILKCRNVSEVQQIKD